MCIRDRGNGYYKRQR